MKRFWVLFLLTASLSGCLSAETDKSKVLARFDGEKITENDFLKKVESMPKVVRQMAVSRKKDVIDDMVAEHFLMKEAMRRNIDKEPDVKDLVETAHRKIVIAKLVEKEVDEKIGLDAEQVAKYYEFHKEEFMTPLLMRASHILVKTEEEANAIKSQLDSGADFEELARAHSIDATAIRGGDLGFFQKGQFVPEFESAVFAMEKGQVSAPVRSSFGYHIIKLNDRAEPRPRELKAVKNAVEERLANEKRSSSFRDLISRLKGNAKIEIDEQALESVSLSGSDAAAES